ncbi:hypothetical protein AAFA72_000729 [Enterococcus faecalis]|nr:hypothetical protein [Enterococcus faecalis]HBI1554538.1 hypothetical protein [Enterococcus faecalis]HBI1557169.1 hypothetical protein [Enterococcus faecalis]HBI1559885.1 hypothetical protein [Enterococcus faecalis]HBI1568783.1 hypothetical protein [Enterococcus faecalis]
MKKFLIVSILIVSIFFSGCTKNSINTMENKRSSSTENKEVKYNTVKNQEELLNSIKEVAVDKDEKMWNKYSSEHELRTSDNGVKKLVGLDGKKELVGYKTYKVIDSWMVESSLTKDKEKDAVWEIIGRNDLNSYVEVYMLPVYIGDVANLGGERLSEDDLDDILANDGARFVQTGMTQIEGENWHIGLEMGDDNNAIRTTFYQMEAAKGSFNESVLVVQVMAPLNKVMQSKENKQEFLEQISQVKKMLTTFNETKEKEVSVS